MEKWCTCTEERELKTVSPPICTLCGCRVLMCPRCGWEAADLRGAGFNASALAAEGTCYWWGGPALTTYHCNARVKPPGQLPDFSGLPEERRPYDVAPPDWVQDEIRAQQEAEQRPGLPRKLVMVPMGFYAHSRVVNLLGPDDEAADQKLGELFREHAPPRKRLPLAKKHTKNEKCGTAECPCKKER